MGRTLAATLPHMGRDLFVRPVFTSHLAVMLKTLATDGQGVAWTPLSLAHEDLLPAGPLAHAAEDIWRIPVDIILVRPRARQSAAAEAFWSAVKERNTAADH